MLTWFTDGSGRARNQELVGGRRGGFELGLVDQFADDAGREHGLVVDPAVDLVEEVGGVDPRAADQLVPAAGVVLHVRGDVVHDS